MMSILPLPRAQLELVRPLLARCPHKPCEELRPPSVSLDDLWLAKVEAALDSPHAAAFVAQDAGAVAGLAVCAEQEWDTRVLEHRTAVVEQLVVPPDQPRATEVLNRLVREVLAWAKERGVEMVYGKPLTSDTAAIHALQRHGFLLMDTLLDYVYDARRDPLTAVPRPEVPPGCTIRLATAADREALLRVSENAFGGHFGRFHADERLAPEAATRVYREWLRSSCEGYADYLFVAEMADRVVGYSVWKKPSALERRFGVRLGHYSIGAVHHDFAGRGVFGAITHAGMAVLDGSVDWIVGPTHVNNYPVQRGYHKLRWRIVNAHHSLHRWLTS